MTDSNAILTRANDHRLRGELPAAVQAYFELLDVDPANAEARAALGPVLRSIRAANQPADKHRSDGTWLLITGAAVFACGLAMGLWLARFMNP